MDEDDVDESTTDGCIDLCETITTDLCSARGCLEKVSSRWKVYIIGQTGGGNSPSLPCKQQD